MPVISEIWQACLERHRSGRQKLNTEEHMLSYVFWAMGHRAGNANPFMKRVCTGPLYRNVSDDALANEFRMILWHLPEEKKRGMLRLYHRARNQADPFWSLEGETFAAYVAPTLGIVPGHARRASDVVRRTAIRMKYRLRTPETGVDVARILPARAPQGV